LSGPTLDLGVIGNCEVAALIDTRGRHVWACLPRPDGDPVFSALLTGAGGDAERGVFACDLVDAVTSEQQYERNTAVLETVLRDSRGNAIRIVDFCPRYRSRGRMFRPMMFIRIVEKLAGRPIVRLRFAPTCDSGSSSAPARRGSHHVSYSATGIDFRLTTDASLSALDGDRVVPVDEPLTFIVGPDETIDERPATLAHTMLQETRAYWHDWVRTLAVPLDWQQAVIRAAITLKLCTYEDTGAILAALTTSVPEAPGTSRNWDYRYCWLRDAYFVVQALNRLGATHTMEEYLHFLDHIVLASGASDLQPLYGIAGERVLTEREVGSLPGYRGCGPVRIGNQAYEQVQHDVYGAAILAASQVFFDERLAHPGDRTLLDKLAQLGQRAALVFDRPDAGPWEFRGREHVHTFSAVVSWAGCDRLGRIAMALGDRTMAARWKHDADTMRKRILSRIWNPDKRTFVGMFDGAELDATLLLLPELGFIDPLDPRFTQTLTAIERELVEEDLVFRYRHADDFGVPQLPFVVCGFWYANALSMVGRTDEARERFEQLLERRNPLGLLSEHVDPATGELWGNYPQTYSLVGIINSAVRLSRPWEAAR